MRELEGTPALAYHSPHKERGHRGGDNTVVATDLNAQGRDVGADILSQVKEEETVEATVGASTTSTKKASIATKTVRKRKLNK